jgi:hypothetical protein
MNRRGAGRGSPDPAQGRTESLPGWLALEALLTNDQ